MKRKEPKSKRKKCGAGLQAPAGSVVDEGGKEVERKAATAPAAVSVIPLEMPPPHYLLEKARGETNRKVLEDYGEIISVLRDEKEFSFRAIADWLTENGVEADYNSVYRVYTKGMSEREVAELNVATDQEEQEG